MERLGAVLTKWSLWLWPVVLAHLWQSTLFAAGVLAASALFARRSARLRHALCLTASAKFLLPSALLFLAAVEVEPDLAWAPGSVPLLTPDFSRLLGRLRALLAPPAGAGGLPASTLLGFASAAAAAVWLSVALLLAGRWLARRRGFARTLVRGRRLERGREHDLLARAQARSGMAAPVALLATRAVLEPGVWGWWRPVLVLPEQIADELNDAELESVFLHELVHVRQRDNLVANLHMLLCCLFWFHPLVWLLDRRLLAEREAVCDERVIELSQQSDAYARSLLKVLRFGLGGRLAGVSGAGDSDLCRRIERIRAGARARRLPFLERALAGAATVLLVAFSAAAGLAGGAPAAGLPARHLCLRQRDVAPVDRQLPARGATAEERLACVRGEEQGMMGVSAAPAQPPAPASALSARSGPLGPTEQVAEGGLPSAPAGAAGSSSGIGRSERREAPAAVVADAFDLPTGYAIPDSFVVEPRIGGSPALAGIGDDFDAGTVTPRARPRTRAGRPCPDPHRPVPGEEPAPARPAL